MNDQEITSIEEGFLEKMKKAADDSLYHNIMKLGIIDGIYITRGVLFDEDICNE